MVLCGLVASMESRFIPLIAAFKAELGLLQVGCIHHGFRVKRHPVKKYLLSHCHVPCSFLGCGAKQCARINANKTTGFGANLTAHSL